MMVIATWSEMKKKKKNGKGKKQKWIFTVAIVVYDMVKGILNPRYLTVIPLACEFLCNWCSCKRERQNVNVSW